MTRPEGDSPQRQFRTENENEREDIRFILLYARAELCENKLRRDILFLINKKIIANTCVRLSLPAIASLIFLTLTARSIGLLTSYDVTVIKLFLTEKDVEQKYV
ncbi:hypothetical protein PUN28_019535 [Cardiocondyla obscurior]|uniref:Uncharacterized protein n=1 Tax=Cardiocondyla obscurior TaxID=286306 RepID=A0AAW2EEE6_9HYME